MNPKTLRRNTLGLSGEHDSEVLCKEICAARNEAAWKLRPLGAVVQQSEQRNTLRMNAVDLFADMIYNPEKQSRISK